MLFLWHLGEKKKFFYPFGVKSTHKKCIQGPRQPLSLVRFTFGGWWCNRHSNPPHPPANVHSPLTVSFLLRLLCLSDQSVPASWPFLVMFKLRIPLGLAPSWGFEPGSQENWEGPRPSLAWVSRPWGGGEDETPFPRVWSVRSVRQPASLQTGSRSSGSLPSSLSLSSRPFLVPSVIIYLHTFLFPLDCKVL